MQKRTLGNIYSELSPELLLTAYYYLKDEDDAKDIVSDVFERLLKLTDTELSELLNNNIKGYLFIVVKHKCFDFLKTKKNRASILQNVFYLFNTKTEINTRFEEDLFEKLMIELPNREAQVLQLSIQGFKNEEIAEQLNISYNTVRNTLHEAKKKTRLLWDKYFN